MENVPPLPYDLLVFPFSFPLQREFGLVQCASTYSSVCIWVLGRIIWSCLYCCHQIRHLFTTLLLHFIIIWLKKKFHLEYIVSLMGRESPIDSKVNNSFFQQLILLDRIYSLCVAPTNLICHQTSYQIIYKWIFIFFFNWRDFFSSYLQMGTHISSLFVNFSSQSFCKLVRMPYFFKIFARL
jgi:hypothetical protein